MVILLILLTSAHVILLSKLIFFPYPELFIYPYLTKIGLIPYKEILDQHFPGLMFFPINLASLGIDSPAEMRILQYLIVIVCHFLLFLISKKLVAPSKFLLLANLLFLIWQPFLEGYVLWIDSFVAPILLASSYFAIRFNETKVKTNLIYIGLLLGIATLFKQVTIPLIVIYSLYLWVRYKKIRLIEYLILGLLVPAFYLIYFVYSKDIISDFVYWTYTFNVTTFAQMGRKFASLREITKILLLFGTACVVIIYNLYKKRNTLAKPINILSMFLIGSLTFAYARFDYVHLLPALPFAVLIITYFFNEFKIKHKSVIITVFLFASLVINARACWDLLGNNTTFYGESEKRVAGAVELYVRPGESIFAFGALPHIYQMTGTVPSGRIFVFQFPWFILKAEDLILAGLKSDPPKLVLRDRTAMVAGVNLVDYMSKIRDYTDRYYHPIKRIGDIELMVPN